MTAFGTLLAAVLISVGTGVGIESAFLPPRYGPPDGRFVAAFPARPRSARFVRGDGESYFARRGDEALAVQVATVHRRSALGLVRRRRGDVPAPGFGLALPVSRLGRFRRVGAGQRGTTLVEAISCSALPRPIRCGGMLIGARSMLGDRLVLLSARATAPTKGAVRTLLNSVRPASW
ncbi:MAG: hypothetical protein M0004_09105 [Actinomycetota bacterium]|nr:hypothetical protein [Actinomycetota bacterium]